MPATAAHEHFLRDNTPAGKGKVVADLIASTRTDVPQDSHTTMARLLDEEAASIDMRAPRAAPWAARGRATF